ncbi:conjugal transfer protein TraR (plasmid) [Caballeronia sp. NK8]|uniref:TraR/DksA family transcriptional regulator n=1 Tax=Caballeronia sp. NK8 TaxID=140098 RepID=UPI001BB6BCFC|nr:TraR/DksA family transcriptional regulator [Caballeronia sp. NK8]BCQ28899.1 conjugal transfer protein TraR [Caballeronia sp. NK8]
MSKDDGLSTDFIAKQRTRLEQLQKEILGNEENTVATERRYQEEHGFEAEELEDEAQRREQYVSNQALRDANDQRIDDIQRALQKIDEGTYGFSDASGAPIPKARLEVMPEAIFTVAEQAKREAER